MRLRIKRFGDTEEGKPQGKKKKSSRLSESGKNGVIALGLLAAASPVNSLIIGAGLKAANKSNGKLNRPEDEDLLLKLNQEMRSSGALTEFKGPSAYYSRRKDDYDSAHIRVHNSDDYTNPSVLAHEFGHYLNDRGISGNNGSGRRSKIGSKAQDFVSYDENLGNIFSRSVVLNEGFGKNLKTGILSGGFASGLAAAGLERRGHKRSGKALKHASWALPALTTLPELIMEEEASRVGYNELKKLGADKRQLRNAATTYAGALTSYGAEAVARGLLGLGSHYAGKATGKLIAGPRKNKRKDEEYQVEKKKQFTEPWDWAERKRHTIDNFRKAKRGISSRIKQAYINWLIGNKGASGSSSASEFNAPSVSVGDILAVDRHGGSYQHYGVVTGLDGKGGYTMTHFTDPTNRSDPRKARVIKSSVAAFAEGDPYRVVGKSKFSPEELSKRAQSFLDSGFGDYSLTQNNCEHFARNLATGEKRSTQVENKIGRLGALAIGELRKRLFSDTPSNAPFLVQGQKQHLLANSLYDIRKHLSKDLGGLGHFDRNQTTYLATGGSVLGGLAGRFMAGRRAKKKAEDYYGLEPGTLEYDNYIRDAKTRGTIRGAAFGGLAGSAGSKAIDYTRGRIIADKAKYGKGLDLGTNYATIGRGFRGVKSEEDIDRAQRNVEEVIGYLGGKLRAI